VTLGDQGAQEIDEHLLADADGVPERSGRKRRRGAADESQEALAQRIEGVSLAKTPSGGQVVDL
jgi:hypothetical protein